MTYTMDNIHELLPRTTPAGIRKAIQREGLPAVKIGRTWLFDEEAVRKWIQRDASPRPAKRVRHVPDNPANYLDEIGDD